MPIRSPHSPLFSPFRLSARDKSRTTKFLDGDLQVCRYLRSIPTLPVRPRPPLLPYQPPHSLAHLLIHRNCSISQRISVAARSRSTPACAHPPAASPPHYWTQSTTPSTPSSSPRLTDHRPALRLHRRSPEHRRSSTPARPHRKIRRNPNLT
jgi:hypothetical protein